jgi:hypothetical protein
MGIGYFNMHVRVIGRDIPLIKDTISTTIRQLLHSKGYTDVPYPTKSYTGESFFVIKTTTPLTWVSVFHDNIDDMDLYEKLSLILSEAIQSDVLSFWLCNHEVMICRYTNGAFIDRYCTDTQAFELLDFPYSTSFPGRINLWTDLTSSVDGPQEIKRLWRRQYECGLQLHEEMIMPFATLLDIDDDYVGYWGDDFNIHNPDGDEMLVDATVLLFRAP